MILLSRILIIVISNAYLRVILAEWSSVGTPTYLTCTVTLTKFSSIVWQDQQLRPLFNCDISSTTNCVASDAFTLDLYGANITSNSSHLTSVFTIKSVTPSQGNTRWHCQAYYINCSAIITSYNISVFAPAETPTCDNVSLLNDTVVEIKCITEKILPEANTVTSDLINGSTTYKHAPSSTAGYTRTECSYSISGDILGPGTHQFHVVMYPNIAINISEYMKRRSLDSDPIMLTFPEAALAPDCHVNDYIKENDRVTCTCYDKNISFISAYVTWSRDGTLNVAGGTMGFVAKRLLNSQNKFTCTLSNHMNWTMQTDYKPKIAYGPDSIKMIVYNQDNYKCDNNVIHVLGTCIAADSEPGARVYIIFNNSTTQLKSGTERNEYMFNVPISTTGTFNITCYANNSLFGDISAVMSKQINIKESSRGPHIWSITNNIKTIPSANKLFVYEGLSTVICEAEEGFHFYKTINLICGNVYRNSTDGGVVFLVLNITKSSEVITCTCQASPESECVENTVSVRIYINDQRTDADNETNGLIIGLGVATGMTVLGFLIVLIIRIVRENKLKNETLLKYMESDDTKVYSELQGTHPAVREKMNNYETPNFKDKPSQLELGKPRPCNIQNKYEEPKALDKNVLGGFIITSDDKKTEPIHANYDQCDITNTSAQENHVYVEVADF